MAKQIKYSSEIAVPSSLDGGFSRYMRAISKFPLLTKEQEYECASSWVKNRDKLSAEKLVSSHLRLVVSMAFSLKGYGIPIGDLIASGNVGLMQALQKFEPEKGFRFSTYATFWIRAEMYDLIMNNWSLVKLGNTAARKKVFFNLSKARRALGIADSRLSDMDAAKIAKHLEVAEADVSDISDRMRLRDSSLNAPKYDDRDSQMLDFVEDLKAPFDRELEEREARLAASACLRENLAALSERDRDILFARRLSDPARTLEDLAARHKISRERVRQIEQRAFSQLRAAMLKVKK
ncbi:MAG: RNA polymerase factor sigma-32 [Rickettsiales bacterium]|jgi:RNA polymerase sigma-32 factor|nr:RNA polymerase factor sigma-32 [Rickettsiales bacterium]